MRDPAVCWPEIVRWTDAAHHWSVPHMGQAEAAEVYTLGFVIAETEETLSLAQENTGSEWRGVTVIPRSCVLSRAKLHQSHPVPANRGDPDGQANDPPAFPG